MTDDPRQRATTAIEIDLDDEDFGFDTGEFDPLGDALRENRYLRGKIEDLKRELAHEKGKSLAVLNALGQIFAQVRHWLDRAETVIKERR